MPEQFEPVPRPPEVDAPEQQIDLRPIEDAVAHVVKETKSGPKTTEFWLTLAGTFLVVIDGIPLPEKYEGFVASALLGFYALSRGLAKQGVPAVEPPPEA